MRYLAAILVALGFIFPWHVELVQAASAPPVPTGTPLCGYCSGPPPPPTPVPTAPAASGAPISGGGAPALPAAKRADLNQASLTPQSVHRGHMFKVSIRSRQGQVVSVLVLFQHHGPIVYRGKIPRTDLYVRVIKVPTWAPLGKANVKIGLSGVGSASVAAASINLALTVLK